MGSTRPRPSGVTEILSEYVRQRQHGSTQQQAIALLRPILERLRSDARQQLAALIRSWEAREGVKYQPAEKQSAFTDLGDLLEQMGEEDLSWLPDGGGGAEAEAPPPRADVHPAMAQQEAPPLPSVDQMRANPANVVYCSKCGRANRPEDAYCYSCGEPLSEPGMETRALEPADTDLYQTGQTYYGKSSVLLLSVSGAKSPIPLRMQDILEGTVGRSSTKSSYIPDIDLAEFRAAELGVSREHAKLRYQNNTITLTDLGSVNHSYVNGQRLHAHEVRVLRDGDEVRLGRLTIRVSFRHEVRPLR